MNSEQLAKELKVPETVVESVYVSMHKTTDTARQMNCRACGFNTCEQMVAAIILDMRFKEDCAHYPCKNSQAETTNQQIADDLAAKTKELADLLAVQLKNLELCTKSINSMMILYITLSSCLGKLNRRSD